MTRAEWTADDDAVVGVVGTDVDPDRLAGADATVVADDAVGTVLERDPTFLVAVGDSAAASIARASPSVPVLPVDAGRGLGSVPADRLERAVESVLDGEAREREVPVLAVERDGDRERALYDVTLVTTEPARISEYAVESGGEPVTRVRADGVVVATPSGSHGYGAAAGGPIVSGAIDGVVVVPIAPFVTRTRRWVLPPEVAVSIERDEGTVDVCVDDRTVETVSGEATVSIGPDEPLSCLLAPEGAAPPGPG